MFDKKEYDKQYIKDNYGVGKVYIRKDIFAQIKAMAKDHNISFNALAYESIKEYIKTHYGIDLDAIE